MDIAGAGAAALTQKAATEAEEVTGIHFSSISVQQLLDLAVTFGISFLVIWMIRSKALSAVRSRRGCGLLPSVSCSAN